MSNQRLAVKEFNSFSNQLGKAQTKKGPARQTQRSSAIDRKASTRILCNPSPKEIAKRKNKPHASNFAELAWVLAV